MKVLIINEECGTGSTGRICTDIAVALENRGDEVKIAYGRNEDIVPEKFQKYAVRIGNDIDIKLHGLKARLFDAAGFGSKKSTKRFIQWVNEYNPDVIHLHNVHGYYINIEILFEYLRSCGKKILWTLHDVWAFTGHSAYCDAVQCDRWKKGCGNCPQLRVYPKSYVDRSIYNWNKKKELFTGIKNLEIIVPSNWLAGLVRESFLKEYGVSVIHNGIDVSIFHPIDTDYKDTHGLSNKMLILSVASVWNNLKGFSDFLKLSDMLNDNFRILMVGGMKKKYIKTLPNNIIYIKRTQDIHEMVSLYNASDVYLNLTYCDTYPTVNLEAIACGTPVITYNVGGSRESAEKFGGKVVKRGDLEEIVDILNKLNDLTVKKDNLSFLNKKNAIEKYLTFYCIDLEGEK